MKKMRFVMFVLALAVLGLILAGCLTKEEQNNITLQGSSTVVFSEVYYDTTGDDNVEEYIELYNKTAAAITVGGWTITDNAGTWTIPSGTSIPAGGVITVARNSAGFKALFGINPTVSGMTLALGNSGDKLTLKNGSTTIDFVAWENYTTGWNISAGTSFSIERNPVTTDTDVAADWKSNVAPTPGTLPGGTPNPNPDPTPDPTPNPTPGVNPAPGVLKVHYIDVGQGDSILIQAPTGEAMLIDAGSYQTEIETKVLNYLSSLALDHINITVATHPHSDHIGSLDAVINHYPIGKAYDSGYAYTSTSYTDYINALTAKNVPLIAARRGNTFDLSPDVHVQVLSPTNTIVSAPANVNDVSVVLRLTYGTTSFILTGDAPQFVEQEIIAAYNVNSDALKVGHHGSYTASAPAFIDAVTPTTGAVIMCGEGNSYGHPHTETLTTLNSRNIPIYRTDLDGAMNGNIVMTSNGTTITVK